MTPVFKRDPMAVLTPAVTAGAKARVLRAYLRARRREHGAAGSMEQATARFERREKTHSPWLIAFRVVRIQFAEDHSDNFFRYLWRVPDD